MFAAPVRILAACGGAGARIAAAVASAHVFSVLGAAAVR